MKRFLNNKCGSRDSGNVTETEESEFIISHQSLEETKRELEEALRREEVLKVELNQREGRLREFEIFFENFGEELTQMKRQNAGSISVIKA